MSGLSSAISESARAATSGGPSEVGSLLILEPGRPFQFVIDAFVEDTPWCLELEGWPLPLGATGPDEPAHDEPGPANGEPVRAPLWEILVEAGRPEEPAPEAGEDPALKVGGARFVVAPEVFQEGEVWDPNWTFEAVRSIQRELRAVIAEEELPVRIEAYKKPDPDGFDLGLDVEEDSLTLSVARKGVPLARVARPWSPITPRSLLPPLVS